MTYLDFSKTKVLKMSFVFMALFLGVSYFSLLGGYPEQMVKRELLSFKGDVSYYFYLTKRGYSERGLLGSIGTIFQKNSEVVSASASGFAESIPVLLYHGILDEPDGKNVTRDMFESQMFRLKKEGWKTINLEDFTAFMRGDQKLPKKSFLLTFDDGAKSSYYPVDPILRALDYQAVTFIIAGRSLAENNINGYYLNSDELRLMIHSGRWEVEAHAYDGHIFIPTSKDKEEGHYYSNKLWIESLGRVETNEEYKERIAKDLAKTKEQLNRVLGINSDVFAFPYGDFAQGYTNYVDARRVLLSSVGDNYSMAFFQTFPSAGFTQNFFGDNTFLIKRIGVDPNWNDNDLLNILNSGQSHQLPIYMDDLLSEEDWVRAWSTFSIKDSELTLSADEDKTGAAVFLDGARNLSDYHLTVTVDWIRGTSFSLAGRYTDSNNYLSCSVTGEYIHLDEYVDGHKYEIVDLKLKDVFSWDAAVFEMITTGDKTQCFIDGKMLVSTEYVHPKLSRGGIGFKVWDPVPGKSEVIIKDLSIIAVGSQN
ncbi:MAG: polysaccharide deacetylase family protein [bacterium]|nr:polysaccharide deacetylase family protein [bacterium]